MRIFGAESKGRGSASFRDAEHETESYAGKGAAPDAERRWDGQALGGRWRCQGWYDRVEVHVEGVSRIGGHVGGGVCRSGGAAALPIH